MILVHIEFERKKIIKLMQKLQIKMGITIVNNLVNSVFNLIQTHLIHI